MREVPARDLHYSELFAWEDETKKTQVSIIKDIYASRTNKVTLDMQINAKIGTVIQGEVGQG